MALLLRKSNRLFAVAVKPAWRQMVIRPRPIAKQILHRRKFSTTFAKLSQDFQQEGIPGSNLPIGIGCKYKLTAGFLLFFMSGFNVPFILLRFVLLNANLEPEDPGVQDLSQMVCFMEKEPEEEEEDGDEQELEPCPPDPCPPTVISPCRP